MHDLRKHRKVIMVYVGVVDLIHVPFEKTQNKL